MNVVVYYNDGNRVVFNDVLSVSKTYDYCYDLKLEDGSSIHEDERYDEDTVRIPSSEVSRIEVLM